MKATIRIVSSREPARGKHIPEGKCEYVISKDGPAMKFRWQGIMRKGDRDVFVFPRDAVAVGRVSDELAKSQARWSRFFSSGTTAAVLGGIVGNLAEGAVRAAATSTKNIEGIGVHYSNEKGEFGGFLAVATPEIIDEILDSMPEDKLANEEVS